MPSFQSSINQLLGTLGVGAGLYSQTEAGKTHARLKQLTKEAGSLEKQLGTAEEPVTQAGAEYTHNLYKRQIQNAEDMFNLKPTEENYQNLENIYKKYDFLYESPQGIARQTANQNLNYQQLQTAFQNLSLQERSQFLREERQSLRRQRGSK